MHMSVYNTWVYANGMYANVGNEYSMGIPNAQKLLNGHALFYEKAFNHLFSMLVCMYVWSAYITM